MPVAVRSPFCDAYFSLLPNCSLRQAVICPTLLSSPEAWTPRNVGLKSILVRSLRSILTAIIHELNDQISCLRNDLHVLPRSDPLRPSCLYILGFVQFCRHELSHQNEELDQCILQLTEAILLPHRPWGGHRANITVIFFRLAMALLQRSQKSKQPDDVNSVIDYFRYLRDHLPEAYDISRNRVMVLLVEAFSIRTRLGSGDRTQDIEDMIALCDELKQDGPADFTNSALLFLTLAVAGDSSTNEVLNPPSDKSIESLRGASMRWPSCLAFSFAFAVSLIYRFVQTFSDDDYNEAVAILNRIIVSSSREDSTEFWSNRSLVFLTTAASLRSTFYGNPEYAEETMSHLHCLRCSSSDDGFRRYTVRAMENLKERRSQRFGIERSPVLQEPVSRTPELLTPRHHCTWFHLEAKSQSRALS